MFDTPLLIHPDKAETILSAVILPKMRGEVVPEARARSDPKPAASRIVSGSGVAVVPVAGMLVRRASGLDAESGLQSYEALSETLRETMNDPAIGGVVLAFDSPGGEVPGLADAAALIRTLARTKPVYAVADYQATSAAYWLASAAEKVFVAEDSVTGSIGVLAVHVDKSARDAQQGLAYTHVYAGARKADIVDHAPLNDEGRATLQAAVDRMYDRFTAAVAKYRGVPQAKVKATEAAVYLGRDAIDAGLADEVGGVDQAVAAMAKQIKAARAAAPVRAPARATATHAPAAPAGLTARGARAHVIAGTMMTTSLEAGGTPDPNPDERELPPDTNNPNPEPGESPPGDRPQSPPPPVPPQPTRPAAAHAGSGLDVAAVRAEAAAGATAHAVRMIRLCARAKLPELAAEYLEKGVSFEAAGEQLVAKMAESQAQTAVTTAHARAASPAAAAALMPNPTEIYRRRNAPAGQA